MKLLRGADKFPKVSSRRVREVWAGLRTESMITPYEVSLKGKSKGRPLRDEIEGDIDQWWADHEDIMKTAGVTPRIDGEDDLKTGEAKEEDERENDILTAIMDE